MMSSSQDLTLPANLPPFSPIVYEPSVKHSFPFETDYSREPARIREVFDELVDKAKEMNLGKPIVPAGKRRARNLGLKVNIDQAKGLHWRSIQARHPVLLTAGPNSPPRTPRRPATDYPSAEQLCLKNMSDAQKRQNYAEACRWSIFAERERAISKWEAEQAAALRARQPPQDLSAESRMLSPSAWSRRPALGSGESEWEQSLSFSGTVPSTGQRMGRDSHTYTDPASLYRRGNEPQRQTVIEMPVSLMDASQSLRPDAASSSFTMANHDQMQSFNLPRGTDTSFQNVRLTRSSSMQRHIPASSLRMAPTPIRPKIDHHAVSYPTPQVSRLSFIQPSVSSSQVPTQSFADVLSPSMGSNIGLSTSQTPTAVPSMGSAAQDQSFADEYSLKKRRNETEHYGSPKIEQRKLV